MVTVLFLAAGLWIAARILDWPVWSGPAMVAGLWAAVVLAHMALPAGHGLLRLTGGDAKAWAVVGGLGLLVALYARVVGSIRARAQPVHMASGRGDAAAPASGEPLPPAGGGAVNPAPLFAPGETERYARHLFLQDIGGQGQRRLKQARVLVVGAGGLGAPVLLYLAAAGVGRITIVDDDRVELSNLQRQIIHTQARVGMAKVLSAAEAMRALNPHVAVEPVEARLDAENGPGLIAGHDLILDGTDNFDTRYLVNRLAVAAGVPLISGALAQWEGQVSLYDPVRGDPCYECVFPERPLPGSVPSCAEAGVAGPLPGVIGGIMAVEAVKQLTGAGEGLRGRLLIHDALFCETRVIGTHPRAGCPVCGGLHRG